MDKGSIFGPNTWTFLMKYDYIGSRFKQFTTKTDIEGKFLTLAEISEGHWRQGAEKNIPPPSLPQQLYNFGGTNRKLLNSRKYKWPKCPKTKGNEWALKLVTETTFVGVKNWLKRVLGLERSGKHPLFYSSNPNHKSYHCNFSMVLKAAITMERHGWGQPSCPHGFRWLSTIG